MDKYHQELKLYFEQKKKEKPKKKCPCKHDGQCIYLGTIEERIKIYKERAAKELSKTNQEIQLIYSDNKAS